MEQKGVCMKTPCLTSQQRGGHPGGILSLFLVSLAAMRSAPKAQPKLRAHHYKGPSDVLLSSESAASPLLLGFSSTGVYSFFMVRWLMACLSSSVLRRVLLSFV